MKQLIRYIAILLCLGLFLSCSSGSAAVPSDSDVNIPALPAPPDNPRIGDVYLNTGSGYLCRYTCGTRAGVQILGWSYSDEFTPEMITGEYAMPVCRAVNSIGIPPVISFPEVSYTGVVNITDCVSGVCYFDMTIFDEDEDKTKGYPTRGAVYIVKLSDDPDSGPETWNYNAERLRFSGHNRYWSYYLHAYKSPLRIAISFKGEKIDEYSGETYADLNSHHITRGIWGFICEAVDYDHNIGISDFTPIKIRYSP
jgi:hypothetical protein